MHIDIHTHITSLISNPFAKKAMKITTLILCSSIREAFNTGNKLFGGKNKISICCHQTHNSKYDNLKRAHTRTCGSECKKAIWNWRKRIERIWFFVAPFSVSLALCQNTSSFVLCELCERLRYFSILVSDLLACSFVFIYLLPKYTLFLFVFNVCARRAWIDACACAHVSAGLKIVSTILFDCGNTKGKKTTPENLCFCCCFVFF